MVSKVFPDDELGDRTLDSAKRIAELPTMSTLLIKEAVNQSVDNMGFYNTLNACFTLHELNHAHWAWVNDNRSGCPRGFRHPELAERPADRARPQGQGTRGIGRVDAANEAGRAPVPPADLPRRRYAAGIRGAPGAVLRQSDGRCARTAHTATHPRRHAARLR